MRVCVCVTYNIAMRRDVPCRVTRRGAARGANAARYHIALQYIIYCIACRHVPSHDLLRTNLPNTTRNHIMPCHAIWHHMTTHGLFQANPPNATKTLDELLPVEVRHDDIMLIAY